MSRIKILPEELANKIAAGEIVERPASALKELMENSVDADASRVHIQARNGGKRELVVTDNGSGMSRDDLLLALERHATSKISSVEDLFSIITMGFRGEALPSIASVSRMIVTTCAQGETSGHQVRIEGGVIKDVREVGAPQGTTVSVENLFYNTPARLKFMKSVSTELDHITSVTIRIALSHPHIHFVLLHNGREIIDLQPTRDLKSRLRTLWGGSVAERALEIAQRDDAQLRLRGFLSPPDVSRSSPRHVYVYINKRWVSDPLLKSAIYAGYKPFLTKGRFPLVALFLEIDPTKVDVNVHPTKHEVRFVASRAVYESVRETVYQTLLAGASGLQSSSTRTSILPAQRVERSSDPAAVRPPRVAEPVQSSLRTSRDEQAARVIPLQREFSARETGRIEASFVEPPVKKRDPVPAEPTPAASQPFGGLKVLAQLGSSYILCQSAGGLAIVDQHAAHERIVYERLKQSFSSSRPQSQRLLMPEVIELSPMDFRLLSKTADRLEKLGLLVEPFGGSSMAVKAVPPFVDGSEIQAMMAEIIDNLRDSPYAGDNEAFLDKTIIIMACHGSVRANQKLSKEEMERLVKELNDLDAPPHCPHGRPAILNINYEQIERDFKRR